MAKKQVSEAPEGMPRLSAVPDASREILGRWMTKHFDRIDRQYTRQIARLREGGEHPSPMFSRMVKRLSAMGTSASQISKLLEITPGALQTHYASELLLGPLEANRAVAETMFSIATDRDHAAAAKVGMEWLNRRGGDAWRPPAQKLEVKSTDEAPVIDSSKLTAEERQQLREMIERIQAGGVAGVIEDQSVVASS